MIYLRQSLHFYPPTRTARASAVVLVLLLFCRRVNPAAMIFYKLDQGIGCMLHCNSTLHHRLKYNPTFCQVHPFVGIVNQNIMNTANDRVTTSSGHHGVGQTNHNFGHWYTKIRNINISGSFPVIMKTHCMLLP